MATRISDYRVCSWPASMFIAAEKTWVYGQFAICPDFALFTISEIKKTTTTTTTTTKSGRNDRADDDPDKMDDDDDDENDDDDDDRLRRQSTSRVGKIRLRFADFVDVEKSTTKLIFGAIVLTVAAKTRDGRPASDSDPPSKFWFSSFKSRDAVFHLLQHFWQERITLGEVRTCDGGERHSGRVCECRAGNLENRNWGEKPAIDEPSYAQQAPEPSIEPQPLVATDAARRGPPGWHRGHRGRSLRSRGRPPRSLHPRFAFAFNANAVVPPSRHPHPPPPHLRGSRLFRSSSSSSSSFASISRLLGDQTLETPPTPPPTTDSTPDRRWRSSEDRPGVVSPCEQHGAVFPAPVPTRQRREGCRRQSTSSSVFSPTSTTSSTASSPDAASPDECGGDAERRRGKTTPVEEEQEEEEKEKRKTQIMESLRDPQSAVDEWLRRWSIPTCFIPTFVKEGEMSTSIVINFSIVFARPSKPETVEPGSLQISKDGLTVADERQRCVFHFGQHDLSEMRVHSPWHMSLIKYMIGSPDIKYKIVCTRLVQIMKILHPRYANKIYYSDGTECNMDHEWGGGPERGRHNLVLCSGDEEQSSYW